MKQTTLVFAGIGLLVLGILVFVIKTGNPSVDSEVLSQGDSVQNTELISGAFSGSMKDLVAKNQSVRCTFSHKTDIDTSSGVVYVSDGKVRGDFTIFVANSSTPFESYMIADTEKTYVWSSLLPQGFVVPISDASQQASTEPSSGVLYGQSLDYTCEQWKPDVSLFVVPSSISFISVPANTN